VTRITTIWSEGDARIKGLIAGVAQLVEQRIRNAKVNSSIPFTGTNPFDKPRPALGFFVGATG
jgi:hypothetical protein